MRRLPVFFVVDVSESMVGENLARMQGGLQAVIRALRADPHALETVHATVIAFAGVARTLVSMTDLATFEPPRLPIGGGTSLGAALDHLMAEIDRTVQPTTETRKGDWRPLVFLFTDGKPTDAFEPAITRWRQKYAGRCDLVAIGLGRFADLSALQRLTERTLLLEKTGENDFKTLIQWVSASVVAHSRSIGSGIERLTLAKADGNLLRLAEPLPGSGNVAVDANYVVLTGRCQGSRAPYLMKYERLQQSELFRGHTVEVTMYQVAGCYPLTEEYFEWSDRSAPPQRISTSELIGAPSCPHCGNGSAFAHCACGGLMCVDGPGEAQCPWCRRAISFGEGGGEFDVNRGRG